MAKNFRRQTPSIFDKLSSGSEMFGLTDDSQSDDRSRRDAGRSAMKLYSTTDISRYNLAAMRNSIRRDLFWLFNTVNLEAAVDLDAYPLVRTSVLNFGVPDLAGKSASPQVRVERAQQIREAILAYEPRIDAASLAVEERGGSDRENALTYEILGDIGDAASAMPVRFVTDIEMDTGSAEVRD
jgi:type VI secretion system protein ImpF